MKTYKLFLAGKILGYNQCHNLHWAKRYLIKCEWEHMTYFCVKHHKIHKLKNVSLSFDIYFKDKRKRDLDNYSQSPCLKGITDGLVRAGVISDDSKDIVKERSIKISEGIENMVVVTVKGEEVNK